MECNIKEGKRHVIWKIIGSIVVFIGVLGIFLPFVPALVLIPAGFVMMGEERIWHWIKKKLNK